MFTIKYKIIINESEIRIDKGKFLKFRSHFNIVINLNKKKNKILTF